MPERNAPAPLRQGSSDSESHACHRYSVRLRQSVTKQYERTVTVLAGNSSEAAEVARQNAQHAFESSSDEAQNWITATGQPLNWRDCDAYASAIEVASVTPLPRAAFDSIDEALAFVVNRPDAEADLTTAQAAEFIRRFLLERATARRANLMHEITDDPCDCAETHFTSVEPEDLEEVRAGEETVEEFVANWEYWQLWAK
jgi:hypothetical protein